MDYEAPRPIRRSFFLAYDSDGSTDRVTRDLHGELAVAIERDLTGTGITIDPDALEEAAEALLYGDTAALLEEIGLERHSWYEAETEMDKKRAKRRGSESD